ncbi:hypothetical protein LP414_00730 [Polaromonas sp. P1(28)-13]|nr:hypothetical protein LP414_00730 [Polaromonas sp. P1(28)-13]
MKRLGTHQTKDFGPLRLGAADLNDLFNALSDTGKIEFIADDVQYDSVSEFVAESRGRVPKVVKIKAANPYLTIDLCPRWARLYVSTDDLAATGLFTKLASILRGCERWPRFLYSGWWVVGSMWALQALFQIPVLKPFGDVLTWLMVANLVWILWVAYVHLWKFSFIQPLATTDARTFWQRNSDSVAVALFSALIGAVGGVAATKAADRWWPSTAAPVVASPLAPASAPLRP